jgi:hypothetical protein
MHDLSRKYRAGVARQSLQRALSARGNGRCAGMEWEYEKSAVLS